MAAAVVVHALFDFRAAQNNELSLRVGDVLLLVHRVDDSWSHVRLLAPPPDGQTAGDVPSAYVERVRLPPLMGDQRLFVATERFCTGVGGDLQFDKGQLRSHGSAETCSLTKVS